MWAHSCSPWRCWWWCTKWATILRRAPAASRCCASLSVSARCSGCAATGATAPSGRFLRFRWVATSRCSTSAKARSRRRLAARLQPAIRRPARIYRGGGPGCQFPAGHRAVLVSVHAWRHRTQAAPWHAAGGDAGGNGRYSRRRDGARSERHAIATWQELRWEVMRRSLDKETLQLEVINPQGDIAVLPFRQ